MILTILLSILGLCVLVGGSLAGNRADVSKMKTFMPPRKDKS